MMRWLWVALRTGARIGIIAGAIGGLIAGLGGSLFTGSLLAFAALAANIFLLLSLLLPLMFYVSLLSNPPPAQQVHTLAAIEWLPAFLLSVAVFMMPVVLAPFLLGKGVTFENSADWYGQVFDALGIGRLLLVAIVSALGFVLVATLIRRQLISAASS